MKSKKIYIGIIIAVILIVSICASIFYIITNNKGVEISTFVKNLANRDTKESMAVVETSTNTNIDLSSKKSTNKKESKAEENKNVLNNAIVENNVISNNSNSIEEVKEEPKKEIVVTPITKTLYVNVGGLNVRKGPDTTYESIGSLAYATEVNVTGKVDGWYRIKYKKDIGYVKASYLTENKPVIEEKVEDKKTIETSATTETSGKTINYMIIINSKKNTLKLYVNGTLSHSYSCATGKSETATPEGITTIYNKIVDRPYYKANIPGGASNNPLGRRWLGLDLQGTKGTTYAIHGTNVESSIGKNASHGCIRMHNADVEELFDLVPIGTTVIIKSTSETDKQIAASYNININ